VQLHWPPYLGWQEQAYLSAMCDMVQAKSASQMGLSNYGPRALRKANDFVRDRGLTVSSNQVQDVVYSM
jgi:pyridoxine 4-dehydrogenase